MQREVSIERFDAHKGEDHAIQMMAVSMRDEKDLVKPMWRPYWDAMMKLIVPKAKPCISPLGRPSSSVPTATTVQ